MNDGPLTRQIIGAFYDVYNELGYGFLESVYSRAMEMVLRERGFECRREPLLEVIFHGRAIGVFRPDLIVDDRVVLENKAGATLSPADKGQLVNYLRVSGINVGLLLHFGPMPKVQRALGRSREWIDLTDQM